MAQPCTTLSKFGLNSICQANSSLILAFRIHTNQLITPAVDAAYKGIMSFGRRFFTLEKQNREQLVLSKIQVEELMDQFRVVSDNNLLVYLNITLCF